MVNILKKTKKIPKRSFSQKIKVLALGIIVVFITLEIALRFAGLVFFRMQEYRNRVSLRNKSSYRIVCLGESTTAMGGVNSYPTQLEEILNQRSIGVKFSVLNLGIPASNTAAILGELEDNLRSYNPDMVISMMGANDKGEYVPYKEGLAGNKVNLTKVFKTYKLARFLWFYVVSKNSAGKSANNADIADVINQDQPATRKEVEAAARKLYGEASPGLYFLNLANDYFIQKRYGEAAECYKKVIGLGFQDRIVKISSHGGVYYSLGECYEKLGRYKDAEVAYQKLIKERPDLGYAKLEKVYEQEGQVQLAKEYSEKAKAFNGGYYNAVTRHNYLELKRILDLKKIKLVSVQYPTRTIEPLQNIFSGQEDIIFVDNENLFKKAIKENGYNKYFIDACYGDFGHCNREGNRLLAENIAKLIKGLPIFQTAFL